MHARSLAQAIEVEKDEILRCWQDRVRGVDPAGRDTAELIDAMPQFIDQLVASLRARDSDDAPAREGAEQIAVHHGAERFHAGFSLGAVIREYGILRECVLDFAHDRQVVIEVPELQRLLNLLNTAMVDAAQQYTREREDVIERQSQAYFAFIAHELRNPLGSAVLAGQALQHGAARSPEVHLQRLLRNLSVLSHLIDKSLISARLQDLARTHNLDLADLSLRDIVDTVLAELGGDADDKDIAIDVDGQASTRADPRLVRSAITNLLRNAIKYTPRGGHVQVRIREARDLASVEVEDECGGLPEGKIDELFTPFVQRGPDRSGFGLGLAIAKEATEALHGTVQVANLPDKGCVFMISLPVRPMGAG